MRASIQTALSFLLCVTALCTASAAADYQGHFERKFQVSGPAHLEIDTGSWDVTVRSGPAGAVSITGKIHVNNRWLLGDRSGRVQELENNPPVRQDGNTIHVEHVSMNNISVDYEITVPADTRVHSRTGSGDVKIQDLNSDLDMESGSGDLTLANITGKIRSHSGSGDVRARDISGPFSAEASSGDIRLEEKAKGNVEIHTNSGSIEVKGVDGELRAETGSGDISAQGVPVGTWEVSAGSGNVHLSLPRDAGFQLDASTSSGELNVSHAVTITVQGNLDAARHELRGTVGGGGPQLKVHTGSGDIDIE